MNPPDFSTCQEVDEDTIAAALSPATSLSAESPRERAFRLVERMAEVSRPRQGAFRVLFVFARMAECEWVEGEIELRLRRDDVGTLIEVITDDGVTLSRLHAPLRFAAPFEEFAMFVDHRGASIAPLEVSSREPGSVLWLRARLRKSAAPERPRAISDDLLAPRSLRGEPVHQKPTTRLPAVKIPADAYRSDDTITEPPPRPEEVPVTRRGDSLSLDMSDLEGAGDGDAPPGSSARVARPERAPAPAGPASSVRGASPRRTEPSVEAASDLDEGWE